jgi:hypothetical protein
MSELKIVYITKFALTKGIIKTTVQTTDNPERVVVMGAYPWESVTFKLGEWHADRERAVKRAKQMRDQKVANLSVQIHVLQELTFEDPL